LFEKGDICNLVIDFFIRQMKLKDIFSIQIKAFTYLIYPNKFIHQLVEVDYKKELKSNKGLSNSADTAKDAFRSKLLCENIQRAKLLRKKLLISFVWLVTACFVPIIVFYSIDKSCVISRISSSNLFALSSIFVFAWATLGRLGWKGQSWKGETVFEQLDKNIFWTLYWIGSVLASLAFLTYKQP
jgi:hypothetical protein